MGQEHVQMPLAIVSGTKAAHILTLCHMQSTSTSLDSSFKALMQSLVINNILTMAAKTSMSFFWFVCN